MKDDFDDGFAKGFDEGVRAAERSTAQRKKPLTLDDIKGMTTDEINARWEEIQPILEGSDDR